MIGACWFWKTSEIPSMATPASSEVAGESSASAPSPVVLTVESTTNPRVRPLPRIEPRLDVPAPLSLPAAPKPFSNAVPLEKADDAIRKGVEYLLKNKSGWVGGGSKEVGYAALPGLALLEAGVRDDEPTISAAAALVRRKAPHLQETYEIALAILFLDRLGAAADAPLIRKLGLRLVAGQTSQYGWDYRCPLLAADLEMPLQSLLEKLQPEGRWQAPLGREAGKGLVALATRLPEEPNDRRREAAPRQTEGAVNLVKPKALADADTTREVVKDAPEALRSLVVAQPLPNNAEPNAKSKTRGSNQDDNSNTQFALLGLWTARRHGVPVDRSLLLADVRFAKSQLKNGAWSYRVGDNSERPSMTCVGLLGLALGHGALLPEGRDLAQPQSGADSAIERGLEALGRSIGSPERGDKARTPNLYFLWSLERVAMMYQLPTIGGKDWYGWGASHLIASQRADGAWSGSDYHGSAAPLDTAFALLFLRRSNLVPDLTERLQLHMAITDPQRR
jgi:hypothetical protein